MKEIDWSKAPDGYDFALSTAADWNGAPELKGTVRFASRDGLGRFKDDTGMYPQIGRSSWEVIAERPVSWAGEGLPPVGTVCEWKHAGQWLKVEVAYLSEWLIVLRDTRKADSSLIDSEGVEIAIDHWKEDAPVFRPLRTPEQIAAEEREKAVCVMHGLVLEKVGRVSEQFQLEICSALYDAGYRKVTP